jgi:hypothetical protein
LSRPQSQSLSQHLQSFQFEILPPLNVSCATSTILLLGLAVPNATVLFVRHATESWSTPKSVLNVVQPSRSSLDFVSLKKPFVTTLFHWNTSVPTLDVRHTCRSTCLNHTSLCVPFNQRRVPILPYPVTGAGFVPLGQVLLIIWSKCIMLPLDPRRLFTIRTRGTLPQRLHFPS